MLMFQHTSARARSDPRAGARSMWLIGSGERPSQLRPRPGSRRPGAAVAAVQVEDAAPGSAEVAGERREQRDGADDVAAARLALEALADPEQRRAPAVQVRRLLDRRRGHTGDALAPLRRAVREQRLELVQADRVLVEELAVEQPSRIDHGAARRPGRRRCPGRLQVQVGLPRRRVRTGSTTITSAGRLPQPVLVLVGRRGRGVGAPDQDAGGVARGARVEAVQRGAVDVVEGDVTGLVADGVGVDLGRAEPVEEAHREEVADQREGAGVVGVEDRSAPGSATIAQPAGDLASASSHETGSKCRLPLGPLRRKGSAAARRVEQHAVVGRRAFPHSWPRLTGCAGSPRTWRYARRAW